MNLNSRDFLKLDAPAAVEINVRPNVLYTEQFSYLTKDEVEVLFLLATTEMSAEGSTSFSFSGIKRQLGKHQQKITKAINRLVTKNLITKNPFGYSLSPEGTRVLLEISKLQNAINLQPSNEAFLEQRIIFDKPLSIEKLSPLLVGKWFSSFRYISHSEGKTLVLRWQLVDSQTKATIIVSESEAILNIAEAQNCDLIIMGGYGRSPILEVVLGSAVDAVLRTSPWPVLVCR